MASVNLPNTDGLTTIDELKNAVGRMVKELSWLLEHLDTRNINELNAEKIVAGSITAQQMAADSISATQIQANAVTTDKIQANSINSEKIQADAVTAEKINVSELSAISADMGKLTSGEIYGAFISTSETQYPRVTLDPSNTAFGVYADANNGILVPAYDGGVSKIIFNSSGNQSTIYNSSSYFIFNAFTKAMIIGHDVKLDPLEGNILVPSWSKLTNEGSGKTLAQELNDLWTAVNGKADLSHIHSVTIPNHNHGNPDNTTSGGGTFTVS